MRLLELTAGDDFRLLADREDYDLPPYIILSHTWSIDADEEVLFQDLKAGTGKSKPGYRKLEFCARQTRRDGLRHFWVDTCCIDKTNSVELNTAITSMFRWYQNAVKCYVYLPDVVAFDEDGEEEGWESDFRSCRWLTRGWTLQELLAPQVVEFFDHDGGKLGDKSSLERHPCAGTPRTSAVHFHDRRATIMADEADDEEGGRPSIFFDGTLRGFDGSDLR